MSHSQFHCTSCLYLDMHGLIFETSIWLLAGSSYPEGNFGGNQLLDGSISLSPSQTPNQTMLREKVINSDKREDLQV